MLRRPFALAVAVALLATACGGPAPPDPVAELPPFQLVDAAGRPVDRDRLAGRVWIANAFFTRCVTICPMLTSRMRALQERLEAGGVEGVELVSISVDPEHDTPERLTDYGALHGVDPRRWTLATGAPDEVRALLEQGFKTHVGTRREVGEGLFDIAHSGRLMLVDREGRIRGWYESDPAGVDAVHRDALALLE